MSEPTRTFYDWMNTDLSAITTLQDADHFYVRDDSASGNAKITFANLKSELHKAPGTDSFAGTTGKTITHNYGSTDYKFFVTPVADPGGYLGEVYVAIAANTAVVYNTGTATGNFDYILLPVS